MTSSRPPSFMPMFHPNCPECEAIDVVALSRRQCLLRDSHRCVVTGCFDRDEARRRIQANAETAEPILDDSGQPLEPGTVFAALEIAYILPPALVHRQPQTTTPNRERMRELALQVLGLLDSDIAGILAGDTYGPANALIMTHDCHVEFSQFRLQFEPIDPLVGPPGIYCIGCLDTEKVRLFTEPLYRALPTAPNIRSPDVRLLAVHSAICDILSQSHAGTYINQILLNTSSPHEVMDHRLHTQHVHEADLLHRGMDNSAAAAGPGPDPGADLSREADEVNGHGAAERQHGPLNNDGLQVSGAVAAGQAPNSLQHDHDDGAGERSRQQQPPRRAPDRRRHAHRHQGSRLDGAGGIQRPSAQRREGR